MKLLINYFLKNYLKRAALNGRYYRKWSGVMVLSASLCWHTAFAGLDHELNHFFNGLGYASNVTQPTAYQDQAAGYYTGGSIFLRNQVRDFQLVSLEWPSFSGGCSGIDSFLGSFSIISADEAIQMMKSILSAAGMYAFDLALATVLPQIRSVKDAIQKYIGDINRANINSCETAEDLVGGVWPKTQATQQQLCRDIGSHNGVFSDWAKGRQGCGTGGQFAEGIKDAGERENELLVNKNLVWAALKKNALLAQNRELAELLMSLSGTVIIKIDESQQEKAGSSGASTPKTQKIQLPSVGSNEDVIKAFLHGGTANFYSCDEAEKCLDPKLKAMTVKPESGLINQVAHLIRELNAQVASDAGVLSPIERGFLAMTPIPILKYITNSLALGKAVNPNQFSALIAISLLNQYVNENIRLVKLFLIEQDTSMTPAMQQQINAAETLIARTLMDSYRNLVNLDTLVNTIRADEQQVTGRLVSQALSDF